jgi:hypothetical protein
MQNDKIRIQLIAVENIYTFDKLIIVKINKLQKKNIYGPFIIFYWCELFFIIGIFIDFFSI